MDRKDKEFLEKNKDVQDYMTSLKQYREGKISKEEFNKLVKTREKVDKLKLDKTYEEYRNKQIAHAALDIGTAVIPMGGSAKITGKIAQKGIEKLTPYLGKKISETIVKGTMAGATTGVVHGVGDGVIDNTNPIEEGIKEGITGGVIGAGTGLIGGKIVQKIDGGKLKKLPRNDLSKYRKLGKQYYLDYLEKTKIKAGKYGDIYFGRENAIKTHPHNLKYYPELKKQLKTAQFKESTNWKNEKDRIYDHLTNTIDNKSMDYEIEVFNNSEKHFKMIKETGPAQPPGTNPGALQIPPKYNVPNFELNFNMPEWLENINAQNKLMEDLRKICELNVFDKINQSDFEVLNNFKESLGEIQQIQDSIFDFSDSFNFTDNSKEIKELINYKPEISSFNENIGEAYSVKKENGNEVVETKVVENIEDKIYPYCLKVSPNEVLKFKTKEEWVDKIGELVAYEIGQASKNRSKVIY